MKVKIGDTVFDGDVLPVMVILSQDDKEFIRRMPESAMKYCCYPDSADDAVIDEWMKETNKTYVP